MSNHQTRTASRMEYLTDWWRDFLYTLRVLRQAKASTAAIVLILSLGIGTTTAVATLLDRLIYRPLPVSDPSQLLRFAESYVSVDKTSSAEATLLSYPGYIHLRDNSRSFSGIIAEAGLRVTESRTGEQIEFPADAHPVSGNFFEVLGVMPFIGRTLAPSDDAASADTHVAVASYRFWTRRYDQSPEAVGSKVYLRNLPFTIVGVLPAEFSGTIKGSDPDLYIPLFAITELFGPMLQSVGGHSFRVIGRLQPQASLDSAHSEMAVLWPRFIESDVFKVMLERFRPDPAAARIELSSGTSGYEALNKEGNNSLFLLAAIVAVITLIGCMNVSCLLLAMTAARRNEISIRLSLGATTRRILRQSLTETGVLAVVGTLAGIALSVWLQRLILIGLKWGDRPIDLMPDGRIMLFASAMTIGTGLICGFAPAYQLLFGSRMMLNPAGAKRYGHAPLSGRILIVMEVALSLVLIAGAAMFLRSFQNIRSVPLGFNAKDVAVIRLAAGDALGNLNPVQRNEALMAQSARLAESLRETPGFESVTASDSLPFLDSAVSYSVGKVEAGRSPEQTGWRNAIVVRVDEDYFKTLQIRLVGGRTFTPQDNLSGSPVGIISETLARNIFGPENPVGRQIRIEGKNALQVIGIAGDIKHRDVKTTSPDLMYLPMRQAAPGGAVMSSSKLQVRTRLAPKDATAIVAERIREGQFALAVRGESAFESDIGASYFDDRIRMQAASLFGVIALALMSAGIYGMIAYSVSQRVREIGIRMAVGATARVIVVLVLRNTLKFLVLGLLLGIPGAVAAMRILSRFVFELSPGDPTSLIAAGGILLLTGLAATAGPALRAAHIDPVQALRL